MIAAAIVLLAQVSGTPAIGRSRVPEPTPPPACGPATPVGTVCTWTGAGVTVVQPLVGSGPARRIVLMSEPVPGFDSRDFGFSWHEALGRPDECPPSLSYGIGYAYASSCIPGNQ